MQRVDQWEGSVGSDWKSGQVELPERCLAATCSDKGPTCVHAGVRMHVCVHVCMCLCTCVCGVPAAVGPRPCPLRWMEIGLLGHWGKKTEIASGRSELGETSLGHS